MAERLFAIVKTGGKQYRVTPGQRLKVEKLAKDAGETVELSDVLLVAKGENVKLGMPTVSGAVVVGKVLGQVKGEKQIIFKMTPKKRYRRKTGHRQQYTEIEVTSIRG